MSGVKLQGAFLMTAFVRRRRNVVRLGVGAGFVMAAAAMTGAGPAAAAPSGQGPAFVGCATKGMAGPIAAPKAPANMTPPPAGLALYVSDAMQALAPVGWSCFALSGSAGEDLVITPDPPPRSADGERNLAVTGPAVVVIRYFGDTSGRFLAAAIDAQAFPIARDFVARVKAEGIAAPGDIPDGPSPSDEITRLSGTAVEYVTPAGRNGLGVSEHVKAGELPIRGAVLLLPWERMDVVRLAVRLPAGLDALAPVITRHFEFDHGSQPPAVSPL